jgi:DNA-binding response OmpR family regulator
MAQPASSAKGEPADKRVLVIDDDEHIRAMIHTTLTVEGFQIKTGRDGRDIRGVAQQYKPHMIVTDLMMPGGGGYEVLRSLQGDDETRKIPVLIITGHHMDDSTKELLRQEPNVVGLLEKPFRPHELTARVHAALHTKSKDEKMIEEQGKNPGEDLDPNLKGFGGIF